MNAKSLLWVGLMVVNGIGSVAWADTLETAEKRLEAASGSITSMTATQRSDIQMDMGGSKTSIKVDGKFEMKVKDGHIALASGE